MSLLALGASAALLVDYLAPTPAFCGGASGCAELRESGVGFVPLGPLAVPLPLLGLLGFSALFGVSLVRSESVLRRVLQPASVVLGVSGVGLVLWQAYLGTFCSFCLVVDSCALLIGVCGIRLRGAGWGEALAEEHSRTRFLSADDMSIESQRIPAVWRDDSQIYQPPNPLVRPLPRDPLRLSLSSWISLGLLVVVAPLLYPKVVGVSEVSASIAALYEDDRPTFVEFFDFQCSHCRDLSPRLKNLAEQNGAQVRLAYHPLGSPGSVLAAQLTICAAEQGKESELAARYFRQQDFSERALRATASEIVPDEKALAACLASNRPDDRIQNDIRLLDEVGFVGLPTTFIGSERLVGSYADMAYLEALENARTGGSEGLPPWAFWSVISVLACAIVWSGWNPRDSDATSRND